MVDRPLSRQQDCAAAALRSVVHRCNTNTCSSGSNLATRSRVAPSVSAAPPDTDARSATGANTTSQRTTARRRRNGKSGGGAVSKQDDGGSGDEGTTEDVEVFNLQTGWSVEALKEGLGAWNVVDAGAGSDEDTAVPADDLDGAACCHSYAVSLEGCSAFAAQPSITSAEIRRVSTTSLPTSWSAMLQPLTLPQIPLRAVDSGELCMTEEDVDDGRTSWSTSNFAAFDDDDDGWSAEPASDIVPDDEDAWSVAAEDGEADDDLDDLDDLDVRAS